MCNTFHTCHSAHTHLQKSFPSKQRGFNVSTLLAFPCFYLLQFPFMVSNICFSMHCSSINFSFQKRIVGCLRPASVRHDAKQTTAVAAEGTGGLGASTLPDSRPGQILTFSFLNQELSPFLTCSWKKIQGGDRCLRPTGTPLTASRAGVLCPAGVSASSTWILRAQLRVWPPQRLPSQTSVPLRGKPGSCLLGSLGLLREGHDPFEGLGPTGQLCLAEPRLARARDS